MKSQKPNFVEDKTKEPKPQGSDLNNALYHKNNGDTKITWEEFIMLRFTKVN